MQFNNIHFPVELGLWKIQNGPYHMMSYYHEWDNSSNNRPYAGGFGLAVFNTDRGNANQWKVLWTAQGQFALKAGDNNDVYAWALGANDHYQPLVGLTHSSRDDEQPNRSPEDKGTFTLANLGQGKVSIQHNGNPFSFRRDQRWSDWGFNVISTINGPVSDWETLEIGSSSQFSVLLLSGSGNGLKLANQDFSEGGYIRTVSETDFSYADLDNASFFRLPDLSLAGCNFSHATLSGARVTNCTDLNKASWNGANLRSFDLHDVAPNSTEGIDFSETQLQSAIFTRSNERANFKTAKFHGSSLDASHLQNVDFLNADFTNATSRNANLDGADLSNANLAGADLSGASLKGTKLIGAILSGTRFDGCNLSTVEFGPSPNFGRSLSSRTSFKDATVPVASLGRDWSYLDLTGANIVGAAGSDLSNLQAQYTIFPSNGLFGGTKFINSNLLNAQMYYLNLVGADFYGSILDGALLKGATLTNANLSTASMKGAWLIEENSSDDPTKWESAKASDAFFVNTCLDEAHCDGVDFSGALFVTDTALSSQTASANHAYMNRCQFGDAILISASFRGTQFSGASFDNAVLINSKFPSAQMTPTSDEVGSAPTMHRADIRGTLFADTTQNGTTNPANMDGLEMQGCTFSTEKGTYTHSYPNYYKDKPVVIYVDYGATVLGTTNTSTVCPNSESGPCILSATTLVEALREATQISDR